MEHDKKWPSKTGLMYDVCNTTQLFSNGSIHLRTCARKVDATKIIHLVFYIKNEKLQNEIAVGFPTSGWTTRSTPTTPPP
jgi:hypothetical protein